LETREWRNELAKWIMHGGQGVDAMKQEPSQPDSLENIADYLWIIALSNGLAIGVGIGATLGSIVLSIVE
jgi:hypothetical protein